MFPDLKPCSCNTMARLIEENVEETRSALWLLKDLCAARS
jgi:hypothetical protein